MACLNPLARNVSKFAVDEFLDGNEWARNSNCSSNPSQKSPFCVDDDDDDDSGGLSADMRPYA